MFNFIGSKIWMFFIYWMIIRFIILIILKYSNFLRVKLKSRMSLICLLVLKILILCKM